MGKGGQTSDWAVSMMHENVVAHRPHIIISDDFSINDSAESLFGAVDARIRRIANVTTFVNYWKAQLPGVRIALCTMNAVSVAVAAGRPELELMYQDTRELVDSLGVDLIDSRAQYGVNLPDTGWTYDDDGLHPLPWVVSAYLQPLVADYCVPIINAMAA